MNLSIRNMNQTVAYLESIQVENDHEFYNSLPKAENKNRNHYWHIQRKSKRRKNGRDNWVFVREFFGTKRAAADLFLQYYAGKEITYRLRHQMTY